MIHEKYTLLRYPYSFYAEIWVDVLFRNEGESLAEDACCWNSLKATHHHAQITKLHYAWKEDALKGIRFALFRITAQHPFTIVLRDLDGHFLHSNCYPMFAAGIMSVFKALNIDMNAEDQANLQQIVSSSRGSDPAQEVPTAHTLQIANYKA